MIIALTLGILSSVHCMGMCGPLFSMLLFSKGKDEFSLMNFIIYQLSRVLVYIFIGFLPLLIGLGYIPVIWQQIIAIVAGILILYFAWSKNEITIPFQDKISESAKKISRKGISFKTKFRFVLLGIANGLLPCGMVYLALTAAIGAMGNFHPALFMFFFGIATIPVFLLMYILRKTNAGEYFFKRLNKYRTVILSLVAVLMILRGLNLGIPMLSPSIDIEKDKTQISCCHAPRK